jgi:hypothetical protein
LKLANWCYIQPGRPEAIRRLIEIALTAKSKRQGGRGEK